jgi:hypothetical protein
MRLLISTPVVVDLARTEPLCPRDPPDRVAIETVLVIHGTGARLARWWRKGREFCTELDQQLENRNNRARCWAHLDAPSKPSLNATQRWFGVPQGNKKRKKRRGEFLWSGANSEVLRREAGRSLSQLLSDLEMDPDIAKYHLVCHSHGGNVALHALKRLIKPGKKLGSVIFLGTPFLALKKRLWGLRLPISYLLSLLAISLLVYAAAGVYLKFGSFGRLMYLVSLALIVQRYLQNHPFPRKLERRDLGHLFLFKSDEAYHALSEALKMKQHPFAYLGRILKEEKPFAPKFRRAYRDRASIHGWFSSFKPWVNLNNLKNPMDIINGTQVLVGLAVLLIYSVFFWIFTVILGGIAAMVGSLGLLAFAIGIGAAGSKALGDDAAAETVCGVLGRSPNSANAIALDSYYAVELVPISDELETAMNKKAGEEFGARVQKMYNKLGTTTSDASLVEQAWTALTDPYLVHAQYYKKETPEVIKKIADLIASDSAAVPPRDRFRFTPGPISQWKFHR